MPAIAILIGVLQAAVIATLYRELREQQLRFSPKEVLFTATGIFTG